MWVDEARHLGLWMITRPFRALSGLTVPVKVIRAGDQTTKRAHVSHAITTVGPDATHSSFVPTPLQG